MRLGIIAPTENEIIPFIDYMRDYHIEKCVMLDVTIGRYLKLDVVALFCGVCKVNAAISAQMLIDKFNVTHIIVIGVSGAINADLNILDTVIAKEVSYHDIAKEILTEYHPWMDNIFFTTDTDLLSGLIGSSAHDPSVVVGRMATGEKFIDSQGREEIIKSCNPLCVDMETASIAHVCYVNRIPFAAIRTISDTPKESGNDVFEKNCKRAGNKSATVLRRYLDSICNN